MPFEIPFTSAAERAIQDWLGHPAQHMSSVKFTLEDFGLTPGDVEDAFAGCRARFGEHF